MAKVYKSIRFIIVFLLITLSALSSAARVRFTHNDDISNTINKDVKQLDPLEKFSQIKKGSRPRPGRYLARVEDHVNFFIESEPFAYPARIH
ncbi:hypothetical protein Bca52824_015356 [Brassica carinata]|uniref:Uncharacterized protein n=1 Tax=Brassica carinata TaxID=52824 RepID=A0A8X7W1J8_BRACI|nr:hypothetical protein Bca52824_015356 [Brassica carinata]